MKLNFFNLLSLLMIFLSLQSCNIDEENISLKDKSNNSSYMKDTVSAKTAQLYEGEYLSHNCKILSDARLAKGLSKEEARQIIYPIEVLEGYVKYIKQQTKESVYIGVHLGQYPVDYVIDSRQNADFKGYQTVYLNANKKGEDEDEDEDDLVEIETLPALNHGSLIPPYTTTLNNMDENFENYVITLPAAKILFDTYTNNNEKILNENGVEVQRSFFYNIEALEGYLKYVKKEMKKNGNEQINIIINIGQVPFNMTAGNNKQNGGNQCVFFTAAPKHYNATAIQKNTNSPINLAALLSKIK